MLYEEDKGFQISRDYKLVYVHVPKTGGTTFEESQLFQEKRDTGGVARAHHRLEHMMVNATERRIEDFLTVATVRHPCERFVSAFYYLKTRSGGRGIDAIVEHFGVGASMDAIVRNFKVDTVDTVSEFVALLNSDPPMWHRLKKKFNPFVPMESWLVYDNGTFGIDVVICQDQWNEGIQRLFDTLQRPIPKGLQTRKQTTDHPSCDSLDAITQRSIMRNYALDACLFAYGDFAVPHSPKCVGQQFSREQFTNRYRACKQYIRNGRVGSFA